MQLRAAGSSIAGGEVADRLLPAVFDDLEVVGREIGDELALPVGDGDAEVDEVDAGPEDRHLLRRPTHRRTRQAHEGRRAIATRQP